jgi:anti-sigma regulatory factor (Ser/Thr protein kinase)
MPSVDDEELDSPSAFGWVRWEPLPAREVLVGAGPRPSYQRCTIDICDEPPVAAVHGPSRSTGAVVWQPYCESHAEVRGVVISEGQLEWTVDYWAQQPGQTRPRPLPAEVLLRLRPVSWATTRARHAVRDFCTERGMTDVVDDAALLTSELVTNAVRHAARLVTMHVVQREGTLVVTVTDDAEGPADARPGMPESMSPKGRGLFIVNELAGDWGMTTKDGETAAWFRLP